MDFKITQQWDGRPTNHNPILVSLSPGKNGLDLKVSAPFFNDPGDPGGQKGEPFAQLWDYEVVEAFFLSSENKYLEVEFCPHGQHLVLLLDGCRNCIKDKLPLDYSCSVSGDTWQGIAHIPAAYFPPKVVKFNAYAIHGAGEDRMYEALYPTTGQFDQPDFHRLDYFQDIDFASLVPANSTEELSTYWTDI